MQNIHNHETLLSPELKEELQEFANKLADMISPVDDIFILEAEGGSLTVITTVGSVVSANSSGYPLTFHAVSTGNSYHKAAILEFINNCFTALMPTPLDEEITDLAFWYYTTFGGYEDAVLSTTEDSLVVKTKHTPEVPVARDRYPFLYEAYRNEGKSEDLAAEIAAMFSDFRITVQNNRVREYLVDRSKH